MVYNPHADALDPAYQHMYIIILEKIMVHIWFSNGAYNPPKFITVKCYELNEEG